MLSVIDAMNASRGFIRPMREGEALLKAGMVTVVGKKETDVADVYNIQALVIRTSGIQSKDPAVVELSVDVSKEYGERIISDNEEEFRKHCDCPAGNSEKCKHIVAVMLWLTNYTEEEVDDISCTDTAQQWGALKAATLKEYSAKKLQELCHVKNQRDAYVNAMPTVTEEMKDRWRNRLMNSCPVGEFSLFMSTLRRGQGLASCPEEAAALDGERINKMKRLLSFRSFQVLNTVRKMTEEAVNNLTPAERAFYEHYVMTNLEKSVNMCSAEQGSNAWKKSRKLRLFASKARAQFTYYSNPSADWDGRFASLYLKPFEGNKETDRGLADEVVCRDRYREKFQCEVLECGAIIRPEVPWLSASLDGVVMDEGGHFLRSIEIKSFKEGTRLTSYELFLMNAMPSYVDANGNMKTKNQHYAQMQLGMLLSGIDKCDYCPYSSVDNDFQHIRIPFDEKHVLELCATLVKVYFENFLPRMVAQYNFSITSNDDDEDDDGDDHGDDEEDADDMQVD